MEIRNLITFTKVAETQSLSKAAKVLGYAQSTVTMQMQQLEQELGAQLYERVGKQIRITQTGQEFLSYAAAIVRMSEEALTVGKQNTSAVSGSLRLGILSPLSQVLSSRIAQYLQRYPQVDLDVQMIQDPEDLLFCLRHNEIDLAITLDALYTETDLVHASEDQQIPVHYYTNQRTYHRCLLDMQSSKMQPLSSQAKLHITDPNLALSIAACDTSQNDISVIVPAPDLIVQNHPCLQSLVRLNQEYDGPALWLQTLYHRNKWLTGAMKAWLADSKDPVFFL